MKVETLEEFLARGGTVTLAKTQENTSAIDFVNKDKVLKELKKLYDSLSDEKMKAKVELAIKERRNLLRQSA